MQIEQPKASDSHKLKDAVMPYSPAIFSLYEPKDIKEKVSKCQSTALHEVVHGFRANHGYNAEDDLEYNTTYKSAIEKYANFGKNFPQHEEIAWLSTPEVYLDIRQGGRMRKRLRSLSEQELKVFCEEIKAALSWVVCLKNSEACEGYLRNFSPSEKN